MWTVIRVETLWWLWLARLDAIYGGLKEDFRMLKEKIIKVEEEYYSRTIVEIEARTEKLTSKGQTAEDAI